jgi:hypothetical protein
MIEDWIFNQLNQKLQKDYLLKNDNFRIACEIVVRKQHYNWQLAKNYYNLTNNQLRVIKSYITRYKLKQLILSRPSIGFKYRARRLSHRGT